MSTRVRCWFMRLRLKPGEINFIREGNTGTRRARLSGEYWTSGRVGGRAGPSSQAQRPLPYGRGSAERAFGRARVRSYVDTGVGSGARSFTAFLRRWIFSSRLDM